MVVLMDVLAGIRWHVRCRAARHRNGMHLAWPRFETDCAIWLFSMNGFVRHYCAIAHSFATAESKIESVLMPLFVPCYDVLLVVDVIDPGQPHAT